MFGCTAAEYGEMHLARVEASRIGAGAGESKTVVLDPREDGAVLGRLLDYDSYGDRTLCDFDPALRITLRTSRGAYEFDVCFSCNDLTIEKPASGTTRSRRVFVHMSPLLRQDLVRLAQRCFPHDRALKNL